MEKFFQIRVKSIEFLQKSAIAIYFYDLTHQVKINQLSSELLFKEK